MNIYGAPPRAEVDASVAVDEAFCVEVEQSLEDGLNEILTEAGIKSPRTDDGTIGSRDVASDAKSKPPVPVTNVASISAHAIGQLMRRLQAVRLRTQRQR